MTSTDGRHQHQAAADAFNAKFPDTFVNVRSFAGDASVQYEQITRLLAQHSTACDVIYSDVVWTADFAQNKWLYDLTPYARPRLSSFVNAMQDAAVFRNRVWGVPKQADAALLYYNKASVTRPPRTLQQLYRQAEEPPGRRLRYQGLDYEGLTVNFLELAYAAGAKDIVTSGGRKANIVQRATVAALRFMVEGVNRAVPREVLVQREDQSVKAFADHHRHADFMRNWSAYYRDLQSTRYPKVAGKVGVAPLPPWNGGKPVSVLGGHVLAISAFARNPGVALQFVDFLTSAQAARQDAIDFSLAPALTNVWEDPAVQEALPAFSDLKSAVANARSRPVTPNYPAVSAAIYTNVHRALMESLTPEEALATANYKMQQALDRGYGP